MAEQMQMLYSNPTTSRDAAESVRESKDTLRATVLGVIRGRHDGATCWEVECTTSLAHQTASARIYELRALGLVKDSGERRRTFSGRQAIVWEAINHD